MSYAIAASRGIPFGGAGIAYHYPHCPKVIHCAYKARGRRGGVAGDTGRVAGIVAGHGRIVLYVESPMQDSLLKVSYYHSFTPTLDVISNKAGSSCNASSKVSISCLLQLSSPHNGRMFLQLKQTRQ